MTTLTLSLQLDDPQISTATVDEFISFMTGPGWDVSPRYFIASAVPGRPILRRAGKVRARDIPAVLREELLRDENLEIGLWTSMRTTPDFAKCEIETQSFTWRPRCLVSCYRPAGQLATQAKWLDGSLNLAAAARSPMGVVAAFESSDHARLEVGVVRSSSAMFARGPYREQWLRMAAHSDKIGTRYVRFPRWGTLYSHAHVAQLGGTAAIVDAVRPAVVRELPGGMYFQLTDSLATALSDEALAKQRRFEDLAAPLLPPPIA